MRRRQRFVVLPPSATFRKTLPKQVPAGLRKLFLYPCSSVTYPAASRNPPFHLQAEEALAAFSFEVDELARLNRQAVQGPWFGFNQFSGRSRELNTKVRVFLCCFRLASLHPV